MSSSTPRHTCLRAEVASTSASTSYPQQTITIFIKGVWFDTHFRLAITDGGHAWFCDASEDDVRERASQWDQPVAEYIEFAEKYLGFQQHGSVYRFTDSGSGHRRLSWTFEKEGIMMEWRWRCKPSSNCKITTLEILDFLMEANIQLSEEVVRKNQAFEKLKEEAEKCLVQSERISREKEELESAIYPKFVSILNSKKAKLREFRDRLALPHESPEKAQPTEEDESTDKTESFDTDGGSGDDGGDSEDSGSSKALTKSKAGGRKRKS